MGTSLRPCRKGWHGSWFWNPGARAPTPRPFSLTSPPTSLWALPRNKPRLCWAGGGSVCLAVCWHLLDPPPRGVQCRCSWASPGSSASPTVGFRGFPACGVVHPVSLCFLAPKRALPPPPLGPSLDTHVSLKISLYSYLGVFCDAAKVPTCVS